MAVNLSKIYGIPNNMNSAEIQHKELLGRLRNKEIFDIPSHNEGYLVLKLSNVKSHFGDSGYDYYNYLQYSKPKGKYIKYIKV